MQLKIKRSQREGVISRNVVFCLDARAEFTAQEQQSITRYNLGNQVIYNSEASKRLLDKGDTQDGSMKGNLKSLAYFAMARMRLNITIGGLARGQHVECKSLDELLGAEEAIMVACRNLRTYLDTAATFNGSEVLFDFTTEEPTVIAKAVTPEPMLVTAEGASQPALAMLTGQTAAETSASMSFPENQAMYELGRSVKSFFSSTRTDPNPLKALAIIAAIFLFLVLVF